MLDQTFVVHRPPLLTHRHCGKSKAGGVISGQEDMERRKRESHGGCDRPDHGHGAVTVGGVVLDDQGRPGFLDLMPYRRIQRREVDFASSWPAAAFGFSWFSSLPHSS